MQLQTVLFWTPLAYLFFMNVLSIVAMWWDKRKARLNDWRVAEVTVHIISVMGGAIGTLLAMYWFHHKTKKRQFQAITFLALLVSLVIYWLVLMMYV